MENYNTILVFKYGQTQLITDTESILVDSDSLTTLTPVLENIYDNKSHDSSFDYTRVAIYNNSFADWVTNNPEDYFKVDYDVLNEELINNLVTEIKKI